MSDDARHAVHVDAGARAEASGPEPRPDVEIDVSVSFAELRPLERSRTRASVTGSDEARRNDAVWRQNLPSRLEPGAVYRRGSIRRRIAGHLVVDGRVAR